MYKNLFFDLDDTLWAFSRNARDTFEEMYRRFDYNRFFRDFDHFYDLYQYRNLQLWKEYENGEVTKEELNRQRFLYPLQAVGCADADLSHRFAEAFFRVIPTRSGVMPHTHEVLDYLSRRYNLYILSNGFHELQYTKMRSADIYRYFSRIILSDDIGILKPHPEIYHHALSVTGSTPADSLMIGDNWDNDVAAARRVGMDQVFYNLKGKTDLPFIPTFEITDLRQLMQVL